MASVISFDVMRTLVIAALALVSSVGADTAWACSCKRPIPDFWETAKAADVVVVARMEQLLSKPGQIVTGFEATVEEVLKGSESRLLDRHSSTCSMDYQSLEMGNRYVIVLRSGDPDEGSFSTCRPRIKLLAGAHSIEDLKASVQPR